MEMQSESTLVLKDLHPEQAGEYYCRASSSSGTIKTKPATLKVIGEFLTVINKYTYICKDILNSQRCNSLFAEYDPRVLKLKAHFCLNISKNRSR